MPLFRDPVRRRQSNNAHRPGPGGGDCAACHAAPKGALPRRAIVPEWGWASHHSQNVDNTPVDSKTCVRCHMEASAVDNSADGLYHMKGVVDLVVYTTFPTRGVSVSITGLSDNLLKANAHCLSCHNDTNSATTPWSSAGDTRTPKTYSWNNRSVGAKYSVPGTTPLGKYSSTTYNVTPADLINKAFSPHGNLANNHGGYNREESRRLNRQYRGKDAPTNVLSFPADLPWDIGLNLLGDILICAPQVAEEALAQGKPEHAHWAHLTIHGVLHRLGYDPQDAAEAEVLEGIEIALLASLGIPNPYE